MPHRKGTPRKPRPEAFRLAKRDGRCNWCLATGLKLTWDHVPPRACGNTEFVSVNRLFADVIRQPPPTAKSRNGLKFATLCASCNSRLGEYDDALGALSAIIFSEERPPTLSGIREVEVRPGAIIRSVLGHMLAAKLESDGVAIDEWIRAYLNGQPLDPRLKVYLWLYPYKLAVVARDFVFRNASNWWIMDGLSSVVKFFPLAFLATDATVELPFTRLHSFASLSPADTTKIKLEYNVVMQPFWPERPDRNHVVFGGAAFFDAVCTIDGYFPKALGVQRVNESTS